METRPTTSKEMVLVERKSHIRRICDEVQNIARAQLPTDEIIIAEDPHKPYESGVNWWAQGPFTIEDGVSKKSYAFVFTDLVAGKKDDKTRCEFSSTDDAILGHELMHIVTNPSIGYIDIKNKTLARALSEGTSMAVEIRILNTTSESNKVDIDQVIHHCQRLVEKNKDLFRAENFDNHGKNPRISECREYDGFAQERDMCYISGLNFVERVLGGKIEKWKFIVWYPPTIAELLEPQKYIDRLGKNLNEYSVPEIESRPLIISQS